LLCSHSVPWQLSWKESRQSCIRNKDEIRYLFSDIKRTKM
jgi:hypothetical protein